MNRKMILMVVLCVGVFTLNGLLVGDAQGMYLEAKGDWATWRGPNQNGIADVNQRPPTRFSKTENVKWVTNVPGKGHGSPIVYGDQVFLLSADEKAQKLMVLCYSRSSGKLLWNTAAHTGGFPPKINQKATHASTTPACDGERVYVNFMNKGGVYTTALTLDGKIVWQTRITDYVIHQGYASSPAIYKDLLLVTADNKKAGAVCALNRASGKIVWKVKRPLEPNYVSPIVYHLAGRDQLLLYGCKLVTSLDPLTGKKIWEVKGATGECVTSAVTDGKHVFTSGGWPKNHVSAVTVDGKAKTVWRNTTRVYVPSMIVKDGYLYAVMDAGVAVCWKGDTGKVMWKKRLGGMCRSSLVLVGDKLYTGNEIGEMFVFVANPKVFKLIAKNKVGDEIYASPAICGGQVFQRVVLYEGDRRIEKLYCIAHGEKAGVDSESEVADAGKY